MFSPTASPPPSILAASPFQSATGFQQSRHQAAAALRLGLATPGSWSRRRGPKKSATPHPDDFRTGVIRPANYPRESLLPSSRLSTRRNTKVNPAKIERQQRTLIATCTLIARNSLYCSMLLSLDTLAPSVGGVQNNSSHELIHVVKSKAIPKNRKTSHPHLSRRQHGRCLGMSPVRFRWKAIFVRFLERLHEIIVQDAQPWFDQPNATVEETRNGYRASSRPAIKCRPDKPQHPRRGSTPARPDQ